MKQTSLEGEIEYMLRSAGPMSRSELELLYRSRCPDSRATHAEFDRAMEVVSKLKDIHKWLEDEIVMYAFHPRPPDDPQPPLTREDIMSALDVLEGMGKGGVVTICYGFPRDSIDLLLNQYNKDVLPWIRAVKEISNAVS